MCDECLHTPCLPRCPNSDEPKAIGVCCVCGTAIRDGDEYYYINEDDVCDECGREYMKQFKKCGA